MHIRYTGDPYWTTARFQSRCKCGDTIKKGVPIFYYPNGRHALFVLCAKCGEAASREFAAMAEDEYM